MDRRRFWLLIGGAAVVLVLGCWLSSGTLAPYGMQPDGPCHYRVNIDHGQFKAVYAMLDGRPAAEWQGSVVLRRILHPLLAYPWMKVFGFDLGGLLFNIFSHVMALLALALAMRRFFDARSAVLVAWLFSTYPGYGYWVGLPYSYAFIVPGSIACLIALLWVHEQPSLRRAVIAACVVGIVGLGYDLMPFFGGALLLMLLLKRRWLDLGVAFVTLCAWALFIAKGLPAIFGFPALNSNTQAYAEVVRAWLDALHRTHGWGTLIAASPKVLASNFLFSNFVFLPVLLVFVVALRPKPMIHRVAVCVLLATLALFIFLNLAPPYAGAWQLRGTWIPRLYQPWFVAVLLTVAAASVALRNNPRRHKLLVGSVIVTVVLNGAVMAGPFIGLTPLYAGVYQRFYRAWKMNQNSSFLNKYGRRPYGICQ